MVKSRFYSVTITIREKDLSAEVGSVPNSMDKWGESQARWEPVSGKLLRGKSKRVGDILVKQT